MASKVYFADIKKFPGKELPEKIEELCRAAGIADIIDPLDMVAVKMHFGEGQAKGVVRPEYIAGIVKFLSKNNKNVFLTDTGTLYWGERSNAAHHVARAAKSGYGYEDVGAPVVIADGLKGMDFEEVVINGEFYEKVRIASAIYYADVIVGVAHFKGHEVTGFGGTIKNLGMGCAPRPGKLEMHSSVAPAVKDKCKGCGLCVKHCVSSAICLTGEGRGKIAHIDLGKCSGCGYCLAICPSDAISLKWNQPADTFQKKMAEYAFGAVRAKKGVFLNFLTYITAKCDCYPDSGKPIMDDIGILASLDPVALDKASLDVCRERAGKDKFREIYPSVDGNVQLEHAQKIGMGHMEYELINIR